jgi:hypothetical protein
MREKYSSSYSVTTVAEVVSMFRTASKIPAD